MARRNRISAWTKAFERSFVAVTRAALRANKAPAGEGDWIAGIAVGATGARRYRLYRPPEVKFGERLPLDGDAARLRPGRQELCAEHAHEPHRGARAFHGALPRAGPPGQRPGLLELVRHPLRARLWRSGTDHEGHRPGLPVVHGGPHTCCRGRAFSGRQHGGAAGHAPSRAIQGGDDAFGHSPGHGAFHDVGRWCDARAIATPSRWSPHH